MLLPCAFVIDCPALSPGLLKRGICTRFGLHLCTLCIQACVAPLCLLNLRGYMMCMYVGASFPDSPRLKCGAMELASAMWELDPTTVLADSPLMTLWY